MGKLNEGQVFVGVEQWRVRVDVSTARVEVQFQRSLLLVSFSYVVARPFGILLIRCTTKRLFGVAPAPSLYGRAIRSHRSLASPAPLKSRTKPELVQGLLQDSTVTYRTIAGGAGARGS